MRRINSHRVYLYRMFDERMTSDRESAADCIEGGHLHVALSTSDYRKLLGVARAAENEAQHATGGVVSDRLHAALNRLNAKPKRGKGAV